MKKIRKKLSKRKSGYDKIAPARPKLRDLQPSMGDAGIFCRHYPNLEIRLKTIKAIKTLPEATRTSTEWWKLGEYLIFNGLMDEDDVLINEGISALVSGASFDPPSLPCILDLAWIHIHKGLPALALPSLEKLVNKVQSARDIWSLKGHCHIKLNQKEDAIKAYEKSVSLPEVTKSDVESLRKLRAGQDCISIASEITLLKINPHDMLGFDYSDLEILKAIKFFFKTTLQVDAQNVSAIKSLGSIQYLLKEYDEAEKLLKGWLEKSDDDAEVLTTLGLIQQKHYKDINAAIIFYQKALVADNRYKLALVNCASLLQKKGEFHLARPYLESALSFEETSIHHAIALDLYGNNVAVIEEDFEKEASLHLQAYKLDPNNLFFIANYIIATLSAGKFDAAFEMYSKHKSALKRFENGDLIETLIKIYRDRTKDLRFFLFSADQVRPLIGFAAIKPLLFKAWNLRTNFTAHLKKDAIPEEELKATEEGCFNELAVLAGHAGAHELAAEIWEYIAVNYDKSAILNKAVELSALGQHDKALQIVNGNIKGYGTRTYTVQGNVRHNAGMPLSAIESYKYAIESEDAFILPITNAINCCDELTRPDLLDPFMQVLQRDWTENPNAQLSLARATAMQGKHNDANQIYQSLLVQNNKYLNPDDLFASFNGEAEDLTLFGSANIVHYKKFAESLLLSGNRDALANLRTAVETWPNWRDGDWDVFYAESLRKNSETERALHLVESMKDQPPTLTTAALCELEAGNLNAASELAQKVLKHEDGAKNFNHPEGRPDAVSRSILSLVALDVGAYDKALQLADEAIKNDVGCPIARTSYANAMLMLNQVDEACRSLQEGLDRRPGSPAMTRMLVETLVDSDHFDSATVVLSKQRQLLTQNDASGLGEKLGELIALKKLSAFEKEVDLTELGMGWALQLSHTSQSWLKANLEIKSKSLDLPEASMFYLAKVIEKEFGDRIFYPFRDTLSNSREYMTKEYDDLSRFLDGDYAPSLGGMRRVLRGVANPNNPGEPKLITEMRQFIDSLETIKKDELLKRATLDKLNSLSHVRNSLAHVGEPDTIKLLKYANFVLDGNKPGSLLESIGF